MKGPEHICAVVGVGWGRIPGHLDGGSWPLDPATKFGLRLNDCASLVVFAAAVVFLVVRGRDNATDATLSTAPVADHNPSDAPS